MFKFLKERHARKQKAKALYNEIVRQARAPIFYEEWGVPDTLDGRFDMISLHCYIVMRRLNAAGQGALSQKLFDVFFVRMDQTLREMAIGDLAVPKHMKRMMQAFNGRANGYEAAVKASDSAALKAALVKNIYVSDAQAAAQGVDKLGDYVMKSCDMKDLEAVFAPLPNDSQEEGVRYGG